MKAERENWRVSTLASMALGPFVKAKIPRTIDPFLAVASKPAPVPDWKTSERQMAAAIKNWDKHVKPQKPANPKVVDLTTRKVKR